MFIHELQIQKIGEVFQQMQEVQIELKDYILKKLNTLNASE